MLASVKEERTRQDPGDTASGVARGQAAVELARQMKALHRYVSSLMMGALQEQMHGDEMSFSQMSALHQLRAHAPMSVGKLAERTGLSLPAASHLTDKLVTRGYAQRRENPDDRRAKLLDLSEQGRQFLDDLDRRFTDSYQLAFAGTRPDTVQRAADALGALLNEAQAHTQTHDACAAGPKPPSCALTPAVSPIPPLSSTASKESA